MADDKYGAHIWPARPGDVRWVEMVEGDKATADEIKAFFVAEGFGGGLDDMWKAYREANGLQDTTNPFEFESDSDSLFANVIFLAPFDGESGSDEVISETALGGTGTLSETGGPFLETGHGIVDALGEDLEYAITGLDINGDFCMEAWVRMDSADDGPIVYAIDGSTGFEWYFYGGASRSVGFRYRDDSGNQRTAASGNVYGVGQVADGEWHHLAIERVASTAQYHYYIDGDYVTSATHSGDGTAIGPNAASVRVMSDASIGILNGDVSNVRITTALRYNGEDYEVPTAPFPTA